MKSLSIADTINAKISAGFINFTINSIQSINRAVCYPLYISSILERFHCTPPLYNETYLLLQLVQIVVSMMKMMCHYLLLRLMLLVQPLLLRLSSVAASTYVATDSVLVNAIPPQCYWSMLVGLCVDSVSPVLALGEHHTRHGLGRSRKRLN